MTTDADRIAALEARIAQLERRIAELEARPFVHPPPTWAPAPPVCHRVDSDD